LDPRFKARNLSDVTHVDGSARAHSVASEDGFIHDLAKAFGEQTGYEVLINTSFNGKDCPMVNSIVDAIQLMVEQAIDGILFSRTAARSATHPLFLHHVQ
jgi:carbamoyltransferase